MTEPARPRPTTPLRGSRQRLPQQLVLPQRVHPKRVVTIDRVVISGAPTAGLDPSTASVSLTATLAALIARQLDGVELPAGQRASRTVRVTWSPTAGIEALGEGLAGGVADALRTAGND